MQAAAWLYRGTSWRLAFLLSAAAHALAVVGLCSLPSPKLERHAEAPCPIITVCEIMDEVTDAGHAFILPRLGQQPTGDAAKAKTPADSVKTAPPFEPTFITLAPGASATPPKPLTNTPSKSGTGNPNGNGQGTAADFGSGSGKGGTAFFGVAVQGQKFVYVIDRSSSMGKQGALTIAKRELLASLNSLPEHALFQVIVFNSTAQPLLAAHPDWFAATAFNKALAEQALALLDATNGTVHDRALILALNLQPDVIFFLTDADDLDPRYLDAITYRNQSHAIINVIELNTANRGRPNMPLQVFAGQNRGVYHAVDVVRP